MQILKARSCPRCGFFLGYSTTRSFNNRRTAVLGSCLHCDYRLPVRAVLRSSHPSATQSEQKVLHLTLLANSSTMVPRQPRLGGKASLPPARRCARELRAVGQALEQLHLKNFSLRRDGRSYLIWDHDGVLTPAGAGLSFTHRRAGKTPMYRFDSDDIVRIERDGISQRSQYFHPVDGRKLSHLLRTLGAHVERSGRRLMGIHWRETSVGVIVESRGRCRVEPIRTDILYDLWVRMYLRRAR